MTESRTLLELRKLSVGYERQPILRGIDWAVQRGTFNALIGPNGSGKSTLLKTIAGLLPPIAGELIFARNGASLPNLGYVPQYQALDPLFLLTTLDVVLMGCYGRIGPGRKVPPQEKALAAKSLEAAEVGDLTHRAFSELSSGQKQRVLVARSLMTQPDLLLLDEPTSSMDVESVAGVMKILSQIHRSRQLTIVMATHDQTVVRRYVETVVWLRNGQLVPGGGDTNDPISPPRT